MWYIEPSWSKSYGRLLEFCKFSVSLWRIRSYNWSEAQKRHACWNCRSGVISVCESHTLPLLAVDCRKFQGSLCMWHTVRWHPPYRSHPLPNSFAPFRIFLHKTSIFQHAPGFSFWSFLCVNYINSHWLFIYFLLKRINFLIGNWGKMTRI